MNTPKLAYIETFGCQMNERDSEIMGQLLTQANYSPTNDVKQADLVLINTCSIRDKAEQKVYSLLGRLKKLKERKPSLIITVAGCVAQQEGKKLPVRMPQVDIVLGTQNIYILPELISRKVESGEPQIAIDLLPSFEIPAYNPPSPAVADCNTTIHHEFKKFVTIMQGCNNFCTYCVVPFTRGREVSRPMQDIIVEITHLAQQSITEVNLLGQNVNSYGQSFNNSDRKSSFPALLRSVADIEGIQRIRFTTSHPKDLSEELMQCFTEIDKLCPHFHLPVQSGSTRILKKMNRKYTIETYLAKVEALQKICPGIAITTDIIVGFPGETDEDFEATMQLLEKVRFHGAYSFKYSDRPLAQSTSYDDKVPEDVKSARLLRLQTRQDEINLERNSEYIGSCLEVLVEGQSKNTEGQWSGRTRTNHIVHFPAADLQPGQLVTVKILEGLLHSLRGEMV
jgi:tRNA-2-methylthio-N6-dimethylallyladenosine synthase